MLTLVRNGPKNQRTIVKKKMGMKHFGIYKIQKYVVHIKKQQNKRVRDFLNNEKMK